MQTFNQQLVRLVEVQKNQWQTNLPKLTPTQAETSKQLSSIPVVEGLSFQMPQPSHTWIKGNQVGLTMKPPKFGTFLRAEPLAKDDMTFNHWIYPIKSSMTLYPKEVLHQGLNMSLKGEASNIMSILGPRAMVKEILEKLETQYGQVASADILFQGFYQLMQEKTEKVQTFAAKLERSLYQLHVRFPHMVTESDQGCQLKERLFYGMHKLLHDSV